MGWFGSGSKGNTAAGDGSKSRSKKKARRFFDHAQTMADSRQYDYAIELYIQGLQQDPDNMRRHEDLYDVALKRKVAGGRPAGTLGSLFDMGGDAVEKMLKVEKQWAMNPLESHLMIRLMERVIEADIAENDLQLAELAFWVGSKILEGKQNSALSFRQMEKLANLFERLETYKEAIEAMQIAMELAPEKERTILETKLRDLQAEDTAKATTEGKTSFRDNIRDQEKQAELEAQDQLVQSETAQEKLINQRRAQWQENPTETDRVNKLVRELLKPETDEMDEEAIKVLQEVYEKTEQYRWKYEIGEIKRKQYARHIRQLKKQAEEQPGVGLEDKIETLRQEQAAFELDEYRERVKNYPTKTDLRFELGKRLYQVGDYEEAMATLQEARRDAKLKSQALYYLGMCFLKQKMYNEAIETFDLGLEAHQKTDSPLALEMLYSKMDALQRRAQENKSLDDAMEAQKVASQIVQVNVRFKDIQQRSQKLRDLAGKLRG
jgi:tetratricopeptide (TPR) repeat protein